MKKVLYFGAISLFVFSFCFIASVHGQNADPTILLTPPGNSPSSFQELSKTIVNWLTAILVPVLTIIVLIGGFQMLTARDNESQFAKGKKTVTFAAIGAAVVLVANGIILVIKSFL